MNTKTLYDGYKPIPNYENYVINSSGHLINTNTGRTIHFFRTHPGYYHAVLIDKDGVHHEFPRSRLLCLAFKPIPNPNEMEVDHVNCDKGDDRLDNLEWVTGKENCQRAARNHLRHVTQPVLVRDVDTCQVTRYNSITETYLSLNLSKDQLLYRLGKDKHRIFPDNGKRLQYSLERGFDGWTVDKPDTDIEFGRNKEILAKNLRTGKIVHFDSISDLCREFHINNSTMTHLLNEVDQPIIPGPYALKFASDPSEWKYKSPAEALMKQRSRKLILATNTLTGKKTMYLDQLDCAKGRGLSPTALNNRLRTCKKGHVFPDGYTYEYVDSFEGSTTSALHVASEKLAKYLAPHRGGDIV